MASRAHPRSNTPYGKAYAVGAVDGEGAMNAVYFLAFWACFLQGLKNFGEATGEAQRSGVAHRLITGFVSIAYFVSCLVLIGKWWESI